jgi:hypothetical protein
VVLRSVMNKPLAIKSSWLTHAHYDAKRKLCTVTMKSGTYCGEITPAQWKAFKATFQTEDSSGKHFNSHLRKLITKRVKI